MLLSVGDIKEVLEAGVTDLSTRSPLEWLENFKTSHKCLQMDALLDQLKTFGEIVDSFPVGAASCVEYSLENEIRKTVDTITLVNARLLMLEAQDKQRKYTSRNSKFLCR